MPIGTIDWVYLVKLSDGQLVEMTSGQYSRYRLFKEYIFPILRVLFFPIRKVYQWWKKRRDKA